MPRLHLEINPATLYKNMVLSEHKRSISTDPDIITENISIKDLEDQYDQITAEIEQTAATNRKASHSVALSTIGLTLTVLAIVLYFVYRYELRLLLQRVWTFMEQASEADHEMREIQHT